MNINVHKLLLSDLLHGACYIYEHDFQNPIWEFWIDFFWNISMQVLIVIYGFPV